MTYIALEGFSGISPLFPGLGKPSPLGLMIFFSSMAVFLPSTNAACRVASSSSLCLAATSTISKKSVVTFPL